MPSNNPRPPKRSWRGDKSAAPRPAAGKQAWKGGEKSAKTGPRVPRGVKIFIALLLFLAAAGAGVGVYLWLRPPPPVRLVLVGAGYEENLAAPANVYGRRGLNGLRKWATDYNKDFGNKVDVHPSDDHSDDGLLTGDRDPVAAQLKDCRSETVMVFLTGDGGGDAQGAYLLPNDASPAAPAHIYRISSALKVLKELPEKTKKLLILDASQAAPDWAMGQLHNDFVRAVRDKDWPQFKDVPNLVILCSCDVDQQSWTSEEYGQTIFAHYVIEGLKGAADHAVSGEETKDLSLDDAQVSALELVRYAQIQTSRWVRHNRAADQTPLLLCGDEHNVAAIGLAAHGAYTEPSIPAAPSLADLAAVWQQHEALANVSPPPYICTPLPWREYEATLLRYEQLLRAGEAGETTKHLRDRLDQLAQQIDNARRRDAKSLGNTLATPAVFGSALPDEKAFAKQFDTLWQDPAKDDAIPALLDKADTKTKPLLRLRLIDLLLAKAAASPDDYKRACTVLEKPELAAAATPDVPLPAEANFAVMAQKMSDQLPVKPDWALLQQGLTVRRTAETAALGMDAKTSSAPRSEMLLPWIQSSINDADKLRGADGEDLLFSSKPQERQDAGRNLAEAAKIYQDAAVKAAKVREALAVRDQALAELPLFTRWRGWEALQNKEENLKALWTDTYKLRDLLENPKIALPDLAAAKKAVEDGLKSQHEEFDAECSKKRDAPSQTPWRELEEVLSVPLTPSAQRMDLIAAQRNISQKLNEGTAGADPAKDEKAPPSAEEAKKLGLQQGRLAAAALGETVENGGIVAKKMHDLRESNWQDDLNDVGAVLRDRLRERAKTAADAATDGRSLPLADVAGRLHQAALTGRLLDAGEALAFLANLDPVNEDRDVRLHDLLVWQAERSRLDYWVTGDPANPTLYYKGAALAYLTDAENLAKEGVDDPKALPGRTKTVLAKKQQFDAPGAVAIQFQDNDGNWVTTGQTAVTDEPQFSLQYKVAGDKDLPAGRPVVWAGSAAKPNQKALLDVAEPGDAGSPSALAQAAGETSERYTVRPHPGQDPNPNANRPYMETADFQVDSLFRGRFLTAKTTVNVYNRPDVVSWQPKEALDGFIAVQAEPEVFQEFAAHNSEMVVVLDYSGSMGHDPKDYSIKLKPPNRRLDKALAALKICLKQLPPGVRLTVLSFNTQGEGASIRSNIKVQFGPKPWQRGAEDGLIDRLGDLDPDGATPLVEAVDMAAQQFKTGVEAAKAKTILVLTDGGDDMFLDGQAVNTRKKAMEEFLGKRINKDSGIQVHVVGIEFQYLPKEEADGAEAFRKAIESDVIGGTFITEDHVERLAADIQQYFLKLHYWVEDGKSELVTTIQASAQSSPTDKSYKNDPTIADEGLDISVAPENLRLLRVQPKDDYYVVVQNHRHIQGDVTWTKFVDQKVHVEPGEVLVLNLVKGDANHPFVLQRDVYADSPRFSRLRQTLAQSPKKAGPDSPWPWLLTVVGDTPNRDRREITAALERTDDVVKAGETLRLKRPDWAWFNVAQPDNAKPTSGLRFSPRPYYSSPFYNLDLAEWRQSDRPVVESWWWDQDSLGVLPEVRRWEKGQAPDQFHNDPSELAGWGRDRTLKLRDDEPGDKRVVVESVTSENCLVQTTPDGRPEIKKCMVVRLVFPKDEPCFVLPPPFLCEKGYEQRFYMEAHRYTGVFYDVDPQAVSYLSLHSVEQIKSRAAVNGRHAQPLTINDITQLTPEPLSRD